MKNSKTILINSELTNISTGTTSSFGWEINNDGHYTHCCVLGCNIPVSYYLIQSPDNQFILTEEGVDIIIAIPPGNYNVNSFRDVVKGLLNTNTLNAYVYDITFDDDFTSESTGKYTFTVTALAPPTTPPAFTFVAAGELHSQFGFSHSSTNSFGVGLSMDSTAVVNFIPETVLKIWSDICDDTELLTVFHDNAIPYSNISFQCQTNLYVKKLKDKASSSIYHFTLLSKSGTKIDLNGQPMSINLLLFTPEDDSYKQDIKNYIKWKVNST